MKKDIKTGEEIEEEAGEEFDSGSGDEPDSDEVDIGNPDGDY